MLEIDENISVLDQSAGYINGKETGDQKGRERSPYSSARLRFAESP